MKKPEKKKNICFSNHIVTEAKKYIFVKTNYLMAFVQIETWAQIFL